MTDFNAGAGLKILVLGGDGVGPEVMAQALRVLHWFGGRLPIQALEMPYGLSAWRAEGAILPARTLAAVHAADAVLFSAAVPGQIGLHHVNCQPHEYWHEKFAQHGLEMTDPIRPLIAHDHRVSPWYRNNTFVYLR